MSILDKFKKKKTAKQSTTATHNRSAVTGKIVFAEEAPKAATTKRSRSAVTGKIVSADEAKKNPDTTVTETVKKEDKLTYSQRQERDEKKRVQGLLDKGWFYTEWGELVPPIVEIDNKKPSEDK